MADTQRMKLPTTTLDLIAKDFAEAVASGRYDQAEGWLAAAVLVADREADRAPATS